MIGSEQINIDRRAKAIRTLNDSFRKGLRDGRLNMTTGVLAHTGGEISALILAIGAFEAFSTDNDPYNEHDFGSLTYMGQPLLWKIDYYDQDLSHGSPDPTDPEVTIRVLTVMMAWEY